ncbi:MAG: DUF4188 domain-containing protein [Azospirillaceae bacterium]
MSGVSGAGRIRAERVTAEIDGDFVVFLIGMRVNKPWRVDLWLPVARAMPRMLAELARKPEAGYLGGIAGIRVMVQYWRSTDHLIAWARDGQATHRPAWADFNRRIRGARDAVGIWHETYAVPAGAYETLYSGMPPFGLGSVGRLVPATGGRESAAGRLGTAGEARAPGGPAAGRGAPDISG